MLEFPLQAGLDASNKRMQPVLVDRFVPSGGASEISVHDLPLGAVVVLNPGANLALASGRC